MAASPTNNAPPWYVRISMSLCLSEMNTGESCALFLSVYLSLRPVLQYAVSLLECYVFVCPSLLDNFRLAFLGIPSYHVWTISSLTSHDLLHIVQPPFVLSESSMPAPSRPLPYSSKQCNQSTNPGVSFSLTCPTTSTIRLVQSWEYACDLSPPHSGQKQCPPIYITCAYNHQ